MQPLFSRENICKKSVVAVLKKNGKSFLLFLVEQKNWKESCMVHTGNIRHCYKCNKPNTTYHDSSNKIILILKLCALL